MYTYTSKNPQFKPTTVYQMNSTTDISFIIIFVGTPYYYILFL